MDYHISDWQGAYIESKEGSNRVGSKLFFHPVYVLALIFVHVCLLSS